MYEVHASAAVPSIFIPRPTGFFVLKIRRPIVQASCIIHSCADGLIESHGISVGVVVVAVVVGVVEGCGIVPSRYP